MSIFINIYTCNTYRYLYFCRKFAEIDKGKRNRNDILNSQVLVITNHARTFFNVKLRDIQQPIRYFKLFTNRYINILLTDFWKKVNSVQQLQNEHM